jgi:class 3 adenylate cyclase
MEPRIQYAQTKDGVSIAYCVMGEGKPLVHVPFPFSHIQLEWQIAEYRIWYERLSEKREFVRYDARGSGLSDRDVADFSLDAQVDDLEAIVDRLGLERFALLGPFLFGPVAVTYAARHPERVSQLLLWCSWARATDAYQSPQAQSIVALRDKDWTTYTESVAHILLGWSAGEPAREVAALMRESVTQGTAQAILRAASQFDVTALLPKLKAPTLVLHRRQLAFPEVHIARGLASRIPDARLALLEGASLLQQQRENRETAAIAIDEFLSEGEEAGAEELSAEIVHTILFTDVEGSTALTDRLGDAKAREVLREHERITRDALKDHGGSEVKALGDGFMASFSSATKALECAIAMQRAFAEWNEGVGAALAPPQGAASSAPTIPIRVRIGLNAGEPIAEDDPDGRVDLFGTAVNLAARIAARASGGEILASNVLRELVAGKGFLFSDRGEQALRGFEDPVRLFEVSWRGED